MIHPNLVAEAIRRYEKFWLPLKGRFNKDDLIPPLDIYWIWHVHMLSGKDYYDDCETVAKCVIDHLYSDDYEQEDYHRESAKLKWDRMFRGYAFNIQLHSSKDWDRFPRRSNDSKIKFNIAEAMNHQQHFYYQVSLKHFMDKEFLQNACARYEKYIELLRCNAEKTLIPPIDVALIWRAHMCDPVRYQKDMAGIFDELPCVPIISYFRRNSPEAVEAEKLTRELWKEKYGDGYSVRGASYRGEAPSSTLAQEPYDILNEARFMRFNISVERITLEVPNFKNLSLVMKIVAEQGPDIELLRKKISKPSTLLNDSNSLPPKFQMIDNQVIVFQLQTKSKQVIYSCEIFLFEDNIARETPQIVSKSGYFTNQPQFGKVHIKCGVEPLRNYVEKAELELEEEEDFEVRGKSYASAWSPIALPSNPPSDEAQTGSCSVGLYRILNHTGDKIYLARVLHSIDALMSGIQIRTNENIQAVAHIIGSNQLPLPDQLSSVNLAVTLDPNKDERGVLVKDNEGDHSIVIGKWICISEDSLRVKPTRENPGFLQIVIHDLRKSENITVHVPTRYPNGNFNFTLSTNGVMIDLKEGLVTISENVTEIAANIALGFACALLFVICRPKPDLDSDSVDRRRNRYDRDYNRHNGRERYDQDYGFDGEFNRNRRQPSIEEIFQENLNFVRAAGVQAEKVPFKVNIFFI